MKSITKTVDMVLRVLLVIVFTVLVACVVWQVFSRFVLGTPSTVTDELARFMFMWIALIGAAYTLGQKRHLAIDLLSTSLSGGRKIAADLIVLILIAFFTCVVMIYGGFELMGRTLASGQVSPALRLPMGYVYGAIPFSGAMILFYCLNLALGLFDADQSNDTPGRSAGPLD